MGKKLTIIGGILCLIGGLVLALWENAGFLVSGLSIINISNILAAISMSGDNMLYLGLVFFILATFSGIFILIGAKVRALSIIFGFLALFEMIILILDIFGIAVPGLIGLINVYPYLVSEPLVPGIIPYYLNISSGLSLGSVVLAAGGLLGFIGGFVNKKD